MYNYIRAGLRKCCFYAGRGQRKDLGREAPDTGAQSARHWARSAKHAGREAPNTGREAPNVTHFTKNNKMKYPTHHEEPTERESTRFLIGS